MLMFQFGDRRCHKLWVGIALGLACFLLFGSVFNEKVLGLYTSGSTSFTQAYQFRNHLHEASVSAESAQQRTLPKYSQNDSCGMPTQDCMYDITSDLDLDRKIDEMELPPIPFLPNFKNPCWYESVSNEEVYQSNLYSSLTPGVYRSTFSVMAKNIKERQKHGFGWRLRCLPYFYIPGISKCGTTDLYAALSKHPDVAKGPLKEPLFWNRIRMETPQYKIGWLAWAVKKIQHIPTPKPFRDYVDLFDKAAEEIRKTVRGKTTVSGDIIDFHHKITGDATPSYLYDFDGWTKLEINKGLTEPRYTIADTIYELTPNAKIIMILRDPANRLFSDYKFFGSGQRGKKSVDDFHDRAAIAIEKMEECLAVRTVRSCIYDRNVTIHSMPVRVRIGMYYPFLLDWLKLFPRENVYITRLEDYGSNRTHVLRDMYKLLGLEPIFSNQDNMKVVNKSKIKAGLEEGMRNDTRAMINAFYKSWSYKLADLLQDDKFKWGL